MDDLRTIEKIRDILMPREFTRVDGIIDLVFSATTEAAKENSFEAPPILAEAKKGKAFTPVNFREACVDRLQSHFKESLVRQSAAIYVSPKRSFAVLIANSREYQWGGGTSYWFGFRPSQKETLEEFDDACVCFGCGSARQLLAIPLKAFASWLGKLNKTELPERHYWHVHIDQEKGDWTLNPKAEFGDIELTKYLLPS